MASQSRDFSLEDENWGGGHGAFTYALIQGLNGAAADNDGTIYLSGLQTYVKRSIPKLTKTQHPTTAMPETMGDFPIAVKQAGR